MRCASISFRLAASTMDSEIPTSSRTAARATVHGEAIPRRRSLCRGRASNVSAWRPLAPVEKRPKRSSFQPGNPLIARHDLGELAGEVGDEPELAHVEEGPENRAEEMAGRD